MVKMTCFKAFLLNRADVMEASFESASLLQLNKLRVTLRCLV